MLFCGDMKQVSFKVAKALKESGYPQEKHNGMYFKDGDKTPQNIIVKSIIGSNVDEYLISAPTVLEVWLWLWKEKGIYLNIDSKVRNITGVLIIIDEKIIKFIEENDPEDAIIAAIEYLVDNNLIK